MKTQCFAEYARKFLSSNTQDFIEVIPNIWYSKHDTPNS